MPEWYEDEALWAAISPFTFSEERQAAGPEEVAKVLKLVGGQPTSALDLGCGVGRHAVPLARHGLRVTAVDRTPSLLDRARERAREAGVEVEWVREDMRRFVRPETFDLALSLFTSFGYFDDADNCRVLENLHRSLGPGGTLVMDMMGKECIARRYEPTLSYRTVDGTTVVIRNRVVDDWTRMRNEWMVLKDGSVRSWEVTHAIYSGGELRHLLREVGFAAVSLFGDLDASPYGVNASRLVAVARKPV